MASKGNDTITKRLHLEIDAQVNGLQDAIASSQKALNSLKMPEANKLGYEQQFKSMESILDKLRQKLAQGVANPKEYEQIGKEISKLEVSYNGLLRKVAELNDLGKTGKIRLLPDGEKTVQTLRKMEEAATKYKNGLKSLENSQKALNLEISSNQLKELKGQQQIIEEYNKRKQKVDELKEQIEALENANNVKNYTNDGKYSNVLDFDATKLKRQLAAQKGYLTRAEGALGNLNPDDLDKINNEIEKLEVNIKKIQDELAQKKATLFTNLKADIANIKDVQIDPKSINSVEELEAAIQSLTGEKLTKAQGLIDDFKNSTGQLDKALKEVKNCLESAGPELTEFSNRTRDLDMLKSRIQYMFGLAGAMQLVRRTFTKAIGTIKELDAAMTETAVVTDYTVSDLWNNINKYTEMGNKVGVSIKGVYEATTLYYQQGLKTDQVFQLTEHTLKMARIAGLDAAEATDRMTNALRGFNMELNETSAQKVADVYSNLAAKTASNVDELSTAMTKVASLANNAGASFENTSAFLAQIIETTRESAETAGTALKTVIARFTEMKKNPLEIQDVEGEEVNVNKVEEALRSVGIMLRDTNGQIRDFDDIILELSGKWNGLSVNTQRYIATIAAGSRQQSRFIALLSDNARLTQLVNDANNAAGASSEQFAKTTESLKTKLQQLENAWNQFILGLTNSTIIKGAVGLLTDFLNVINGLTKSLPGLVKNVSNFFLAFGAFKGLKGIANIFGLAMNEASLAKSGGQMGDAFIKSLQSSIVKGGKKVAKSLKNIFSGKNIKEYVVSIERLKNIIKTDDLSTDQKNQATTILNNTKALNLYTNAVKNGMSSEAALAKIKTENIAASRHQIAVELAEAEAQAAGNTVTQADIALKEKELAVNNAGFFSYLSLIGAIRSVNDKKAIEMALNAGVITTLQAEKYAADAAAGSNVKLALSFRAVGAAIKSIPIIGWILALVAALGALISLFYNYVKDNSVEERQKRISESIQKTNEEIRETTDLVDGLKDSWDKYKDVKATLDSLVVGSTDWKEALIKVNSEVQTLLDKYPGLAKFIETRNGIPIIKEEGYDYVRDSLVERITRLQAKQNLNTLSDTLLTEYEANDYYKLNRNREELAYISLNNGLDNNRRWLTRSGEKSIEDYYKSFYGSEDFNKIDEQIKNLLIYSAASRFINPDRGTPFVKNVKNLDERIKEIAEGYTLSDSLFKNYKGVGSGITYSLTADWNENAGVFDIIRVLKDIKYLPDNFTTNWKDQDQAVLDLYKYFENKTDEEIKELSPKDAAKEVAKHIYLLNDQWMAEQAQDFYNGLKSNTKEIFDNYLKVFNYENISLSEFRGGYTFDPLEKEIEEALKEFGYLSSEAFFEAYKVAESTANRALKDIKESFKSVGASGWLADNNDLTIGQLKDISNTARRFGSNIGGNSQAYLNFITELRKTYANDSKSFNEALQIINSANNTQVSIDNTVEAFDELGYNTDGLSGKIKSFIGNLTITALSVSEINNALKTAFQTIKDIKDRDESDRTFDEDIVKQILKITPELENQFVFNGIDYTYIGDSMYDLVNALRENTKAILGDTKEQLAQTISYGEKFTNTITYKGETLSIADFFARGYYREEDAKDILSDIANEISDGGNYSRYNVDELREITKKWYDSFFGENGILYQQALADAEELERSSTVTDLINTIDADEIFSAKADSLQKRTALLARATNEIRQYVKALEIGNQEEENFYLGHLTDVENKSKEIDKFREKWESVSNILKTSSKNSAEFITSVGSLLPIIKQLFGEEAATMDFFTKNQNLFEKIGLGGESAQQAIVQIQQQVVGEDSNASKVLSELGNELFKFYKDLDETTITSLEKAGAVVTKVGNNGYMVSNILYTSLSTLLGGGSGSGSDTETPERAFDWLYNLTAYINKEMRERNKLEKEYNLLLSKEGTTVADIHKNLQDRINLLAQESAYQQQMIDKRVQEREQLLKEAAQDNVTKYFDFVNGRPQIKFEQLDKLRIESPDLYELVQQYESKFNEINDEIESAEDAIYDNTSEIEELRNQGRDDFIDLEQTIFDAIVELRENEIKKLEEVNNSINDTNSSLISAIQKQLNKERQSRQNAEKETQIQNKELQLSYLQQSTDADPLKVKQLQEELANLREDYTDTLIDQKINELEEQNEAAKTQRDRQISILNDQLEQDKESGKIWEEVNGYMMNLGQTDGSVDNIKELLSNTKNYFTKSDVGKGKFFEDLTSQILSAGAWQKGFSLPVTATLPDGSNFDEVPANISNIAGNIQGIRDGLTDGTLPKIPITGIPKETPNQDISMPISNMYADQWARGKNTDQIAQNLVSNYGIDTDQLKLAGLAMINGEDIYLQKDSNGRYYLVKRLNNPVFKNKNYSMFATGGLSTETGPAWLDGTPSHPEYVLNPTQTQAFLQLPDLLQQLTNSGAFSTTQSTQSEINGDNYYEINLNVERIDSDYSVDRMAERVKEIIVSDAHYRNVNAVNLLR